MNKILLSILLSIFGTSVYSQVYVFVHQTCHYKTVQLVNHEIVDSKIINDSTTLFILPSASEPRMEGIINDTFGYHIERFWVEPSSDTIHMMIKNCNQYKFVMLNGSELNIQDQIYARYCDYLRVRYRDNAAYKVEHNKYLKEFILAHPNSYLSLYFLSMLANQIGKTETQNFLDTLRNANDKYELFKSIENNINFKHVLSLGDTLRSFDAQQIDGSSFNFNDLPNKITVINFWSSTCHFSKEMLPKLISFQKDYATKDINFVYFCLDLDAESWKSSSLKYAIPNWNISDLKGMNSKAVIQNCCINATPSFMVLDAHKRVRLVVDGNDSLALIKEAIDNLLHPKK